MHFKKKISHTERSILIILLGCLIGWALCKLILPDYIVGTKVDLSIQEYINHLFTVNCILFIVGVIMILLYLSLLGRVLLLEKGYSQNDQVNIEDQANEKKQ